MNHIKKTAKNVAIFLAGATLAGIITYNIGYDNGKTNVAENIFRDITGEAFVVAGDAYMSEGFEFSPGGGYFYYPKGKTKLTSTQRNNISDRLDQKLHYMKKFEKKISKLEEKYLKK